MTSKMARHWISVIGDNQLLGVFVLKNPLYKGINQFSVHFLAGISMFEGTNQFFCAMF